MSVDLQVHANDVKCSFNPSDITIDPSLYLSDKILLINENIIFDVFTNLYGVVNDETNTLGINWLYVKQNFKGIAYINLPDRLDWVYFYEKKYPTWINLENTNRFYIFSNNINIERSIESDLFNKSSGKSSNKSSSDSSGDSSGDSSSDSSGDSSSDSSSDSASSSEDLQLNHNKPKIRYFKMVDPSTGNSFGRFTGVTPRQAASKAFTTLLQKRKTVGELVGESINDNQSTEIHVKESTRGCSGKTYCYKASRTKLPEPLSVSIKNPTTGEEKTIIYKYNNRIIKN